MLKTVFFVVAGLYLIWRVLQGLGHSLNRGRPGADAFSRFSAHSRDRRRRAREGSQSEELVACTSCGTSVPGSRLVRAADGEPYCSACADQSAAV